MVEGQLLEVRRVNGQVHVRSCPGVSIEDVIGSLREREHLVCLSGRLFYYKRNSLSQKTFVKVLTRFGVGYVRTNLIAGTSEVNGLR